MINDMTKGSPIKLILSFMVPLLIGNINLIFDCGICARCDERFCGYNRTEIRRRQ